MYDAFLIFLTSILILQEGSDLSFSGDEEVSDEEASYEGEDAPQTTSQPEGHPAVGVQSYLAQADAVYAGQVKPNSRKTYRSSQIRFLMWFHKNTPYVLGDVFRAGLDEAATEAARTLFIQSVLGPPVDKERPPLKWDTFSSSTFTAWILTLRKRKTDEPPGFSTMNTHRSGLFNLFRDFKVPMSASLEQELSGHFKGLRRQTASSAQAGAISAKTGKDPMSFSMYRWMCMQMMKLGRLSDFVTSHAMLTLSWNLMCRISNTVEIKHSHLVWDNDSLGVIFVTMKNDQGGERPRDSRHVFANPLMPEICPILSLGLYLICYPTTISTMAEGIKLFPGGNQDDRFGNAIDRVLNSPEGREYLTANGLKKSDFGTHSVRKGSATYTASGSTACPSISAIHRRAGWSMGKVLDIYIRYEDAGDQHVGRTASGLPPLSAEFATLPPYFSPKSSADEQLVALAVQRCFPQIRPDLRNVAAYCLASAVYHSTWLLANLPAKHVLFTTYLFRDTSLLARLKPLVQCHADARPTDPITATGIPPHTAILALLQAMKSGIEDFKEKVASDIASLKEGMQGDFAGLKACLDLLPQSTRKEFVRELERRAMLSDSGTPMTRDSMRALMEDLGLIATLERLQSSLAATEVAAQAAAAPTTTPTPVAATTTTTTTTEQGNRLFAWGDGRLHCLPIDFKFSTMSALSAWQLWCCGDPGKGYIQFKKLEPHDLNVKNARKRLSDLRTLMLAIEDGARDRNVFVSNPTIEQANTMFLTVMPELNIFGTQSHSLPIHQRHARATQMTLNTTVKLLRKKRKADKLNDSDDD